MAGRKIAHKPCEYEQMRLQNIEDNKAMLQQLMIDLKGTRPPIPQTKKSRQRPTKRQSDSFVIRRNPYRISRYNPLVSPPRLRSRSGSLTSSLSSSNSSPQNTPQKMVLRFGFMKREADSDDYFEVKDEYDEDDMMEKSPRRIRRHDRETKSAEEITDEDLELVAGFVSDKRYDSAFGTTCHQCRQKTDDLKTICRSEQCFGVRGQFCGPCLRNRYGEDAKVTLKDPDWLCPPCRGICNCSFCRRKSGRSCTGILVHLARQSGYEDVNSYLKSLKK